MTAGARPAGAHRVSRHGSARRPGDARAMPAGGPLAGAARKRGGFGTWGSALRFVLSAGLIGLTPVVFEANLRIRDFEAMLSSYVIGLGTRVSTGHLGGDLAMAWFTLKPDERVGLVVTPECTVALLSIPFLAATALLLWQHAPIARYMTGLCIALALLVALNQFRLLVIAWFVLGMGYPQGYYWGHTVVGSIITIFGLAATLAVYMALTVWRTPASRGRGRGQQANAV
jgi:exosortase/archaeosortase family protein